MAVIDMDFALGGNNAVVLYDTAFQDGSVTLYDTIANYKEIEIDCNGFKQYYINNNSSNLSSYVSFISWDFATASNVGLIICCKRFTINGNSLTITDHQRMYNYPNYTKWLSDSNVYGSIRKIIGYK